MRIGCELARYRKHSGQLTAGKRLGVPGFELVAVAKHTKEDPVTAALTGKTSKPRKSVVLGALKVEWPAAGRGLKLTDPRHSATIRLCTQQ